MSDLKKSLREFAGKSDIDLLGFGARERFMNLEPKYDPFSIFPEGKTVILIGERITRGSLRGVEEGSNFNDYSFYSYRSLDDVFNAQACYDVTCLIHDSSHHYKQLLLRVLILHKSTVNKLSPATFNEYFMKD